MKQFFRIMLTILVLCYLSITNLIAHSAPFQLAVPSFDSQPVPFSTLQPSSECDKSLWNNVYNPKRLEIKNDCIEVTGRIVLERKEMDGDVHIQVKLDNQFNKLLNQKN